jgi:hypothetical protein
VDEGGQDPGDREPGADPHTLIQLAALGLRTLTPGELATVLSHVARAGFDPAAMEVARSAIAGQTWQNRAIVPSDRVPSDVRHYLLHVVVGMEWPTGTTMDGYVASIRDVILDPTSGVFTNEYGGALALGVIRESGALRGPGGYAWVLVQYRVARGHWMTAFQPVDGPAELDKSEWGTVRWLRMPKRSAASSSD